MCLAPFRHVLHAKEIPLIAVWYDEYDVPIFLHPVGWRDAMKMREIMKGTSRMMNILLEKDEDAERSSR